MIPAPLETVQVMGGGPAGASAALAALLEGCSVQLLEKSRFPRHKVCGEFLSPEIAPALDALGVWDDFLKAGPARIRNLELHFGSVVRRAKLPESAYGLSRFRFDELLLKAAVSRGAELRQSASTSDRTGAMARVLACGRAAQSRRGGRLFGFKSHFTGPVNDAVELYFGGDCYVGLNPIEGGLTNVCGLAAEDILRGCNFEFDRIVHSIPRLKQRLIPMERSMRWYSTGPLVFEQRFRARQDVYAAGDALCFVDPFTGSGLLSAVITGRLAGLAAMRRTPVTEYASNCRRRIGRPFVISSLIRKALMSGWAERLVPVVPASWLVQATRTANVL